MPHRFGLQPPLIAADDWVTLGSGEDKAPKDWVYLGKLSEYGRQWQVRYAVSDEKVIAVFGKRGQGKSFTLGALIEGLATQGGPPVIGSAEKSRAVLLIDPLNIFQWIDVALSDEAGKHSTELSTQVARARAWGLADIPISATIYYPAGYPESALRSGAREFRLGVGDFQLDEWSILLDVDVVRDVRGQLMADLFTKVTLDGWRGPEDEVGPAPNPTLDDYRACLATDVEINSGIYSPETVRAVSQRLRAIAGYEVFQGTGTRLTEFLRAGSISVLLMNALPEQLRHVVVSVLTRRIITERAAASAARKDLLLNPSLSAQERMSRENLIESAPPRTWVVVDEAQDIIPAGRKTAATEAIVKLVKEGRNFGLSFILTTQQPRAIDSRVLSQVETFFVHRLVSRADVDVVLDSLKCPLPSEIRLGDDAIGMHELIALLDIGQIMVSDTYARRCTVVAVRARVGAHGGFEA